MREYLIKLIKTLIINLEKLIEFLNKNESSKNHTAVIQIRANIDYKFTSYSDDYSELQKDAKIEFTKQFKYDDMNIWEISSIHIKE